MRWAWAAVWGDDCKGTALTKRNSRSLSFLQPVPTLLPKEYAGNTFLAGECPSRPVSDGSTYRPGPGPAACNSVVTARQQGEKRHFTSLHGGDPGPRSLRVDSSGTSHLADLVERRLEAQPLPLRC